MIKTLLASLLFSLTAYAEINPTCPTESILIQYISPVTHGRVVFCGYQKNGATVKHGEELTFDSHGSLVKTKTYNHGEEGATKPYNIPGTEEAARPEDAIRDLVEVLTLKKGNGSKKFKVNHCDDKPRDWVMGAVLKKPIIKSYKYLETCDVQGSFTALFDQEFPINFELRHLQDFNHTKMNVKMSVNKANSGIRYQFEVLQGTLKSPKSTIEFRVQYQVDIDPLSGETHEKTQSGQMTIMSVDGVAVNRTTPLSFD